MNPKLKMFLIRIGTGIIFSLVFWGILLYLHPAYFATLLLTTLMYILAFEIPLVYKRLPASLKAVSFSDVLLALSVIVPFTLLIILTLQPVYHDLLYHLFFVVFTFDTGAYVVGSTIGKHTLFPTISPKKTWEGLIGGYVLTLLTWFYFLHDTKPSISFITVAWLTAAFCLVALLGDALQSWIKRKARLKDTGAILPGHGGLLDRFDSTMTIAIVFFLFRIYLAQLLL